MKLLQKSFEKKGWHFQLVERQSDLAIYKRWKNPENPHFEVVRIKEGKEWEAGGKKIEAAELYPSAAQWGASGWTFTGPNAKDDAFQKFVSLQKEQRSARFDAPEDTK